ncbi:hypothetical protein [Paenibacillus tarimensis]|uniref:hypothetical protein n=1 Tax=Paenibacillus tarimensis TaxID=416012 RepID=UPI0039F00687|nr:prominin family protein [Paenibacillus tarimensis]
MRYSSYWYLGLVAISVVLLILVYYKSRNHRSFALFLGMVGVSYCIEFVIFTLLGSYQYYPGFIKHNSYYDSNIGSGISNFLILPSSAAAIAVFRKGWLWIVVTTGLFAAVEWLFLHLQIYRHNWWSIGYTALGLPFYYLTAKAWYNRIMRPMKGLLLFVTLVLITGAILGTLMYLPIAFLGVRTYHIGWFENISRDTTVFVTVYWLVLAVAYTTIFSFTWSYAWPKYVISLGLLIFLMSALSQADILRTHAWWDPYYCVFVCLLVLLYLGALRKRLLMGPAV